MTQPINFKSAPSLLAFEINSRNIKVSKTLKFIEDDKTTVLNIKGLIYHGDIHSHLVLLEMMVVHGFMMV
jgi:hypothetical protein